MNDIALCPSTDPWVVELRQTLAATFAPEGVMESVLVDLIALNLSRTRQLAQAQYAKTELRRLGSEIEEQAERRVTGYGESLVPDERVRDWYLAAQKDYAACCADRMLTATAHPHCWELLRNEADNPGALVKSDLPGALFIVQRAIKRALREWDERQQTVSLLSQRAPLHDPKELNLVLDIQGKLDTQLAAYREALDALQRERGAHTQTGDTLPHRAPTPVRQRAA